jgi:streptogramin lyase
MPSLKTAALSLALALTLPAAQAAPAACPQVGEQLSESLASARQRIRADGEVRVAFDVSASGRAQLVAVQGTRAYRTPVRTAVDTLECQAGTPQRYVLDIRFAEPRPRVMASAASATLAQVQQAQPPAPR